MQETVELRLSYKYAHLLFGENEGRNIDNFIKVIEISKDDSRYYQIPIIHKQVEEKYDRAFYFSWHINRKYTKEELATAPLLHTIITKAFDPTGEECGTLYDETVACTICKANRVQKGPLRLKRGSIPKKSIARSLAGEVVVSEKFIQAYKKRELKGASFEPVLFAKGPANYYQLVVTSPPLELTQNTIAGSNPFGLPSAERSSGGVYYIQGYKIETEEEVYKCPLGHTIGLNLISEPYVADSQFINSYDIFITKQKVGAKQGLLQAEPVYLCSQAFRKMVEEEELSGFKFEVAHVE